MGAARGGRLVFNDDAVFDQPLRDPDDDFLYGGDQEGASTFHRRTRSVCCERNCRDQALVPSRPVCVSLLVALTAAANRISTETIATSIGQGQQVFAL